MRRLIWVCTVCLCPTKRSLGLYGLSTKNISVKIAIAFTHQFKTCYEYPQCIGPDIYETGFVKDVLFAA